MNKKICLLILSAGLSLFFAPHKIFAADLNVSCPVSSGCAITGLNPLFGKALDGYWYPGKTITKTINLKNAGKDKRQMVMKAIEKSNSNILKQVMNINIAGSGGPVIWAGSLNDFYNKNYIILGSLDPGQNKDFNFKAGMNVSANNDYQGLTSVFDLTLGFAGETDNLCRVSGFNYFDFNRNDRWDGWLKGEFGMNGWRIFIDKNNNNKYDKGEDYYETGWDGKYSFDKLSSGDYSVCEVEQSGWESSLSGHATCQKIKLAFGEDRENVDFGNNSTPKKRR